MNHLFDQIRAAVPSPTTVLFDIPGATSITYGEMLATSARLAHVLVAHGVRPGDRVTAQVEKSPPAIFLYLACLRAGAVFMPLNAAYTLPELEYFVGDAEPRLLIGAPEKAAAISPLARKAGIALLTLGSHGEGTLMDAAAAQPAGFTDVSREMDHLAALVYTSGTTGRSKGAMLTHGNLASNAQTLAKLWRFGKDDCLLHALPIFHTHGLFVATNVILLAGASMIFMARFDADQIVREMPRATCLMGVPTFYVRLLQHPGLTREASAHMRLFISGSAPLLAETHIGWTRKTGHAILERYGMTETNMIASNPYDGARVPGAVGLPLPGVDVRIAEAEGGALLPQGDIGMIEVRGPNVFTGYWRMPEKTKAEFRPDGYFITGDLGKIDDSGYVHIVGRGKDLVITGGYNVYPKEVESEIDALPGVLESAVIGLPHKDFGEGVTAVVVARPGAVLAEKVILAALEGRLARYKQPKRVVTVAELPRNAMGKVQKNVLQAQFKGLYEG